MRWANNERGSYRRWNRYREAAMTVVVGDNAFLGLTKVVLNRRDDRCAGVIGNIQIAEPVQRSRQKVHRQHKCREEPARKAQQRQALKMKA